MGDLIDWPLLGFIAVNFLAASSGAVFKPGPWYQTLAKPWWCPPNWAFPIVWTIIFAMIAVSGWVAYYAAGGLAGAPWAFIAYGVQLAFNAGWSAVFFGLRRPDWGLVEVAFLWSSIVVNIALFALVDWRAAALLLPYLAWVTVAARLNQSIVRLNPRERGRAAA
jgi:tryptophan-rich sensory protein